MIEEILAEAKVSEFDFRRYAHPQDPLAHLFDEWVPYYRLKTAIAKTLQPKSILEIGVRYGYSAQAFLHGSLDAEYIGIDNDSSTYGGSSGALDWAKETLSSHKTSLLQENTQHMEVFPGETYDLIHIDGQQDGYGTYHDLELALAQGRWILVDGYFWTEQNFRETNEFLLRHKDVVDYSIAISGYAGELIIKTNPSHLKAQAQLRSGEPTYISSKPLAACYDQAYFLHDCGGHESYRRNGPERIDDPRLLSILALISLKECGRLLDIGCGRGEIAFQSARKGFRATGLDYSEESISIASKKLVANTELESKLDFRNANAADFEFEDKCDIIVASDLIEHITPLEVDACYERVSRILGEKGLFIVHTFPNSWYYRYHYERRKKQASTLGAFLPAEPRTRFERLMHINEQNPRVLLKQLKKNFSHVLLWFAEPRDPTGSLVGSSTPHRIIAYRDIYAIASHSPVDRAAIVEKLSTRQFSAEDILGNISLRILNTPFGAEAEHVFPIHLEIENRTSHTLGSLLPHPMYASYHWKNPSSGEYLIYDGIRTPLQWPIPPGKTVQVEVQCKAPFLTGEFDLIVTLVQEHHAWFDQAGFDVQTTKRIQIAPNRSNKT